MTEQLQLELKARREKRGPELAKQFVMMLDVEQTKYGNVWVNRKALHEHWGWTDRMCRLARQFSSGRVLAGQKGYRLTRCASIEEIRQAAATLESQATAMMSEAKELWRVLHCRDGKGETQ